MTHANGVVTNYTYDAASQLLNLAHQLGATSINSFAYAYDRAGNRTSKTSRDGAHNYTYDTLNRLTQSVNPLPTNPLETFNYDPVGNRTTSNQNGASTFNQGNQLSEDANFTYQYDNNGDQTRKTAKVGGAVTQYEYEAENKLVRVVSPSNTANYKYDGLGRRVEKEVIAGTTATTRYVYDKEDILLELNGANAIVARYTHGPGIDEPLVMEKNSQSVYYHADGLGSITEMTNQSGSVAQRYAYSSFGKIESQLDPSFVQPYTFTSREFDSETGLYYYRARQYDSSIGRFLQEDPVGISGGQNFYAYVHGNPVLRTDAFGLFSLGGHDAMIGFAFADRLSSRDIRIMQQASREFDQASQGAADAYKHSMRQSNQSPDEAIRLRDQLVGEKIEAARRAAQSGNRDEALRRIGEACHPIMDSFSPMHTTSNGSPKIWNPWWPFGHSPNETYGNETRSSLTPQILVDQSRLLNAVYDKALGR